MKKWIFLAVVVSAATVFAESYNQSIAADLVAILNSKKIQEVLSAEDQFGDLKNISYVSAGPERSGPGKYEIVFEDESAPQLRTCKMVVLLNLVSKEVIEVSAANCSY